MTATYYQPRSRFHQLQQELERVFDTGRSALIPGEDNSHVITCDWVPAVDIKEEQDRFLLWADIPGVNPNDVEITLEKGMLTIKGERKLEAEQARQGYRRVERARGVFYRRFSLPETADLDKIAARGTNGVLQVTIPKHEHTQPRRITVGLS